MFICMQDCSFDSASITYPVVHLVFLGLPQTCDFNVHFLFNRSRLPQVLWHTSFHYLVSAGVTLSSIPCQAQGPARLTLYRI